MLKIIQDVVFLVTSNPQPLITIMTLSVALGALYLAIIVVKR